MKKIDLFNTDLLPRDVERDYLNSYFILETANGNIHPAIFQRYAPQQYLEFGMLVKNEKGHFYFTDYMCEPFGKSSIYLLEPTGYYNLPGICISVIKRHRRQFRCGYNERTFSVNFAGNFNIFDYLIGYGASMKLNYQRGVALIKQPNSLMAYIHNQFYKVDEAIELLLTGKRLQCAISPMLALSLSNEEKIILMYSDITVGYLHKKKQVFKIPPIVSEDIMDVLLDNGVPI